MFVQRIVTGLIDDGITGGKTRQHIHMPVGVIAGQITVLQPENTRCPEKLSEGLFGVGPAHVGIPVGIGITGGGGQDGAMAIGFDAPAFENQVDSAEMGRTENPVLLKFCGNGVVEIGPELSAPAIKLAIQKNGMAVFEHRDGPKIASPGVIGWDWVTLNPIADCAGVFEKVLNLPGGGGYHDYPSVVGCFSDNFGEGFLSTCQVGLPIGCDMRPSQQDAVLFFPFGWKSDGVHRGKVRGRILDSVTKMLVDSIMVFSL